MPVEHEIEIRVRYSETDAMGWVHHSRYLNYFEMGRTELFRADGGNYRRMEELGLFFVVASLSVRYRQPARYDDVLVLRTRITRFGPVKLEHSYQLLRDEQVLCEATSVLACVDASGNVQPIPDDLARMTGTTGSQATPGESSEAS